MTYLDHFCAGVAVGSFAYTSDSVSLFASATNETTKREFDSDWKDRRTHRAEYQRNGAAWALVENRTFVYDDWNLIYERSERPSEGAAELAFFWGPDLSGTLQGAGGVGGLVAVSVDGDFYFPGYDNNGNVVGYWDEAGSLVAEYAYDAFGNTISSSGSMASVFPHRFSTKYYDTETDLYYYGYRYYSPSLGRWISRDPIGEYGGNNLVLFCRNAPFMYIDSIGREPVDSELFINPDNEKDIPWGKKKLPLDTGGQTEPFFKVKCCLVKIGNDPKNNNRPLYGMKCIVHVVLRVYLNSEQTQYTRSGSYGHEQQHVAAFITEIRSTLETKFKNIKTLSNSTRSYIDNQIERTENSIRSLLNTASDNGKNHRRPHPPEKTERPPNGTMPEDPIPDNEQPSLPKEIKCDECP